METISPHAGTVLEPVYLYVLCLIANKVIPWRINHKAFKSKPSPVQIINAHGGTQPTPTPTFQSQLPRPMWWMLQLSGHRCQDGLQFNDTCSSQEGSPSHRNGHPHGIQMHPNTWLEGTKQKCCCFQMVVEIMVLRWQAFRPIEHDPTNRCIQSFSSSLWISHLSSRKTCHHVALA